ncbi:MAG: TVP38/TMEM64 family protein [Planctomycetota bacterium]
MTEPLPLTPPPATSEPKPKPGRARYFFIAWFVIGALAFAFLPLKLWLTQFSAYILSLGWIAPFAYIATYIGFCIFLIPSIALSMGVGPVFGFWKGLVLTVIAANIGGTIAFVLGRTVLRKRVELWAADKPKFKAIDTAVERRALTVVILMRLSPIFPFTIINYVLSMTRIPYWKFALGTFIGMLPLNAAFLYISCETAKVVDEATKQNVDTMLLGQRIIGIVLTLIALTVMSRIALKAIKTEAPQSV